MILMFLHRVVDVWGGEEKAELKGMRWSSLAVVLGLLEIKKPL